VEPSLFTRLAAVEAELLAMKDMRAELKVNQDELRRDRDEWRWRAERLLADLQRGAWWRWCNRAAARSMLSQRAFAVCSAACSTSCPRRKRAVSCAKAATNGAAGPSVLYRLARRGGRVRRLRRSPVFVARNTAQPG
jgi:hypothetical protein